MRINSINNNLSFGRVVKISNVNENSKSNKQKNNTQEIVRVLKNQSTKMYSKEEAAKIKDFFAETLGDYNGKNEIIFRKTNDGTNVIISGNEANTVLLMELRKRKTEKRLNKQTNTTEKIKETILKKHDDEINKFINRHFEDGRNQKTKSDFYLKSSSASHGRIDLISYEQITKFYSAEVNGHMLTKDELKKYPNHKLHAVGLNYYSQTLDLNK